MKLAVQERTSETKKDINVIRREGNIPAVIYSPKTDAQRLTVSGVEFAAALRQIQRGSLPTTVFMLSIGKKERRVIVKDIQYNPTSYAVIHIDFEELSDDVPVRLKVPVNCSGVMECVGVKLGGFLRQVMRHVKVECLPKDIPSEFLVDVAEMGIRQTKRLKDVVMGPNIRVLTDKEQVLVVIAKR